MITLVKSNPVMDKSFVFSLMIIDYTEKLEELRKYNLARQLFKSGTSIGANIKEGQSPESRADFIHKMKIAYKEAEETEYWLNLCKEAKSYPFEPILLIKLIEIKKLLSSIITSAKNRQK